MRFEMARHGSVFGTRDRGIQLLAALQAEWAPVKVDRLVMDFAGVHTLTDSFTDAFVVKLVQQARDEHLPDPVLENMNDAVERAVSRCLELRGLSLHPPVLTPAC